LAPVRVARFAVVRFAAGRLAVARVWVAGVSPRARARRRRVAAAFLAAALRVEAVAVRRRGVVVFFDARRRVGVARRCASCPSSPISIGRCDLVIRLTVCPLGIVPSLVAFRTRSRATVGIARPMVPPRIHATKVERRGEGRIDA
jgi:hypothetical protein